MKSSSISDIRKEIAMLDKEEVSELCLKLAKFSKSNKEMLSYLLFYSGLDEAFVAEVKEEMDVNFEELNSKNAYLAKKTVRKIQRMIKKYAHYSTSKEIEIELRIYFCSKFNQKSLQKLKDKALQNIYQREIPRIEKLISTLHEDLQFDYTIEFKKAVG